LKKTLSDLRVTPEKQASTALISEGLYQNLIIWFDNLTKENTFSNTMQRSPN
jgi:hypothetical protein